MTKYSEKLIAEIKEVLTIEHLLEAYKIPFRREQSWFKTHCINPDPGKAHKDKGPSLKWKVGDQVAHCFACEWNPDVYALIGAVEKCDFPTAVERALALRPERGSEGERIRDEVKSTFKPQDVVSSRKFIPMAQWDRMSSRLFDYPEIVAFLEGRGLTRETMVRFKIAPFPNGPGGGCEDEHRGCPWVAIPYLRGDRVVSVKYRDIHHKEYTSSLGDAMFNSDGPLGEFDDVFLTFGEFDAIILEQAGFRAVSAQSDSRPPSVDDRGWLLRAGRLFYAGDSDKSGLDAQNKIGMELRAGRVVKWPQGSKDANEFYLRCASTEDFAEKVSGLVERSVGPSPPGFSTLVEHVRLLNTANPYETDPQRFRMPWPTVDRMFYLMPGHVIVVASDVTGTGKSTFVLQAMLHNAMLGRTGGPAMKSPAIYAAEQSPDELARMAIAQMVSRPKTEITSDDITYVERALAGVRFFLGYDPSKTKASEVLDLCETASRYLGVTDLVIDNMGFVGRNEGSQLFQAQSNAMQRIKNLSKKTGIRTWVLVAARAARGGGERGKFIAQDDVGGTAAFESDADHIISLHRKVVARQEIAEEAMDILDPVTTVVRKKSRWPGPGAASTKLVLRGQYARFDEYAAGYDGYNQAGRDRAAGADR